MVAGVIVGGLAALQWMDARADADRVFAEPVNNGPYQAALAVAALLVVVGAILYRRD